MIGHQQTHQTLILREGGWPECNEETQQLRLEATREMVMWPADGDESVGHHLHVSVRGCKLPWLDSLVY